MADDRGASRSPRPSEQDLEDAIEEIVNGIHESLAGRVSRERVETVTRSVAARFSDATVKSYVTVFVRRHAEEELRASLDAHVA